MRTSTLLLVLLSLQLAAQQPRIWGMTTSGGANNKGVVFAVDADGTDFSTVFAFDEASGWGPEGGLCLAPNGLLYGMTTYGGEAVPAAGTLFTIDPATGTFTKLIDFNITNGGYNQGALIVGADGLLYGAAYGGTAGGGSIFRVDPTTNAYTELYALTQSVDGAGINSRLLQTPDGLLYGAASQGGANFESGTLFRYDIANDVFTKLHDFDGADGGRTPYGGLCQAENGWLYGTTFEGGTGNSGIIYKYDPVNDEFEKVFDFEDADGANCWNTLVNAGPDLLAGAVGTGGLNSAGFLFTLVPSTDTFTLVNSFAVANGSGPVGSLVAGAGGPLYGTATLGGASFYGTLYRFDPITLQRTTIHGFTNGADGGQPRGEVVVLGGEVGVAETVSTMLFSVGPNPSSGQVTLNCDPAALPLEAHIADAWGRVSRRFTVTRASSVIDLGIVPGIRCITISGANASRTERVVVD
ncbi:MAG: hypothetical protein IPP33_15190 [Flavobacteriales bacterium]|nr:hypothetical protein [Flavobacteriales bacterium]